MGVSPLFCKENKNYAVKRIFVENDNKWGKKKTKRKLIFMGNYLINNCNEWIMNYDGEIKI